MKKVNHSEWTEQVRAALVSDNPEGAVLTLMDQAYTQAFNIYFKMWLDTASASV